MKAAALWSELKSHGFDFYSGVPDSTFGAAYDVLTDDPQVTYVPAVREDVALGVVSAAHLCGRRGAVVMQNSGLGNVVNALTSFNLVYRIPALLIVGWRGYPGTDLTAPEHSVMGAKTEAIVDLLELPSAVLTEDGWPASIADLVARMDATCTPAALLVPPGVLS